MLGRARIVLYLLCAACAGEAAAQEPPARELFVSVLQDPPVLTSRAAIERLVDDCRRSGTSAIYVQIYRSNLAWFASEVGDDRPYRECLTSVGEDPLALLVRLAHAEGIQVHAWLNLLSLGANEEAPLLKRHGPGILTRGPSAKNALQDYKVDNQYFLEPGDPRVREALSRVVAEVARAYPQLDGILFDYIRYPDWLPDYGYTEANVERYRARTGLGTPGRDTPAWGLWKTEQVTSLLDELGREARRVCPDWKVSTTGLAPYSRAALEAFQDWKSWIEEGRADFVTLMCYVRDPAVFERYLADARRRLGSLEKLNIAVGAYALRDDPETFRRQLAICERSGARACVILHYGDLLEAPALTEPAEMGV